uniref:Uncharacterized protein n=1 Tax=Arundo donax TaxID=35708 RepID=A0A0A9BSC5_ARUDO
MESTTDLLAFNWIKIKSYSPSVSHQISSDLA